MADNRPEDELRPRYDFKGGVRGKYIDRFGTTVVLDPDVAKVFPTSEKVNDALRGLMQIRKA